jgi:hypothetical protein
MIRAKDAVVARVFQAQCRIPRCPWKSSAQNSYEAASRLRQQHLDLHRGHFGCECSDQFDHGMHDCDCDCGGRLPIGGDPS